MDNPNDSSEAAVGSSSEVVKEVKERRAQPRRHEEEPQTHRRRGDGYQNRRDERERPSERRRPRDQERDRFGASERFSGEGGRFNSGGGPSGPKRRAQESDSYEIRQIKDKLRNLNGGTLELPPLDMKEKKFTERNRLYVGGISGAVTSDDLKTLFLPFGAVDEEGIFVNPDKNFAFVTLDYHANAARAQLELNGTEFRKSNLKVRFTAKTSSVKVKNLPETVTNELLNHAFQIFGDIQRAIVLLDERGRPKGEGLIDFARARSATFAINECEKNCFFLTGSLRPVIVEEHHYLDDIEGFSEKHIRKNDKFYEDRKVSPWFANSGSFEEDFGNKWKQLRALHKEKQDVLNRELELEEQKLEAQMMVAKFEFETEMLKKELEARQNMFGQYKDQFLKREQMAEEQRLKNEEQLRRRQEMLYSQQNERFRSSQSDFYEPPPRQDTFTDTFTRQKAPFVDENDYNNYQFDQNAATSWQPVQTYDNPEDVPSFAPETTFENNPQAFGEATPFEGLTLEAPEIFRESGDVSQFNERPNFTSEKSRNDDRGDLFSRRDDRNRRPRSQTRRSSNNPRRGAGRR